MAWTDFFSKKAQPAPGSNSFILLNADSSVSRTLAGFFKEGYGGNPIVYSCISVIAKNAASVKLEVKQGDGDKVLTTHALLDLLRKPNPSQNGKEFFKELVTYHQAAGEAFVLRLPETGKPAELYNLDPRHIDIEKPKTGGLPVAFIYGSGENKKRYPVNPLTGECQVLHIKGPNLLDDWRGMAPLAAAAVAADTHNAGGRWNFGLLKNSARPSGVLEIQGQAPGEGAVQQIRNYFTKVWTGETAAGRMPVLTQGMKFTPLSLKPTDMDFGSSMTEAAKNIALVYGVPLPLVTTEAATFSNMDAALERLWSDTVLPLLDEVIEALSDFLTPYYGKGLQLTYNADSVPALEAKRSRKFERMVKAVDSGLLTPNEARVEVGFDLSTEKGADLLYMKGTMRPLDRLNEAPAKPGNDNQPPAEDEGALAKAMRDAGFTAEETARAMSREFGVK